MRLTNAIISDIEQTVIRRDELQEEPFTQSIMSDMKALREALRIENRSISEVIDKLQEITSY